MRTVIKVLILLLSTKPYGFSKAYCDLNTSIKDIYSDIIQLELTRAGEKIKKYSDKENIAIILLEDYIDFFQLFIYEKEGDYVRLKKNKSERIKIISESNLDENWSLFIQSEIQLHWSLIHLKRGENWKAFHCVSTALLNLEHCNKKYPEFIYSKKSLGILHTLISTIPREFEWATKLAGINGDISLGKRELNDFIQFTESTNNFFLLEAKAAYAYVVSFLDNQPGLALRYWNHEFKIIPKTPTIKLLEIKIINRARDNKLLDALMEEITMEDKKKLPYLYYLCGLHKLQNLNYEGDKEIIKFLETYEGQNYRKEAYQKLTWSAFIQGNKEKFEMYRLKCLSLGTQITDEDQQAQLESKIQHLPDILLLKARLLCDGNHLNRAYHLLFRKANLYQGTADYIEYCYRMGRICEQMNNNNEAIAYYQETIFLDSQGFSHFSALSMLYTGSIYEKIGNFKKACEFYNLAYHGQAEIYSRSIHQKASAGKQRLQCSK